MDNITNFFNQIVEFIQNFIKTIEELVASIRADNDKK